MKKENQKRQAYAQWEKAGRNNDFVFSKLMRNTEICKGVIEILLDIEIDHISYPEEQKTIDISAASKSVRLDVYVKDGKDTVYNLEMQVASVKDLPERSRYYQDMIDLNLIEKGAWYSELCQSYVIFICNFDPFEQERCVYHFQNRSEHDHDLLLGDRTHKYFFNTRGKDEVRDDLRQVLNFFNNNLPEANPMELIRTMEAEFKRIKANTEWSVEYMTLYMKYQEQKREGYDQGWADGEAQAQAAYAEREAAYAEEKAAYVARESSMLAEIAALKQQLSALSPKQ